jgi:uncharacterized membrane-anchored protein YitT (DUF2179 family)
MRRLKTARFRKARLLAWDYLLLTGGALLLSANVNLFLAPNRVISSGVTGIGMLAHYVWGWPIGLVTLGLNIPIFVAGIKWGGWRLLLRSVYATAIMTAGIDLLAPFLPPIQGDPLIFTLFGGLLDGVGIGLVLRGQGTTGGTDIIAQLLYALIVNFVSGRVVDTVQEGSGYARAFFIVSTRSAEIQQAILDDLERGVTLIDVRGGYTEAPLSALYVVVSRSQVTRLKRLISERDPTAFVVVSEAHEVLGEGFRPIAHKQA